MKKVIAFNIAALIVVLAIWVQGPLGHFPDWLKEFELPINCMLIATLGGVLYCLRAVYIERCVRKNWDSDWEIWYFLRPITSTISGLVAYVFLKAGLIILEADQAAEAGNYGFLALSFIAGFNVSNFSKKIEDIAKSTFGIEKSNSSRNDE